MPRVNLISRDKASPEVLAMYDKVFGPARDPVASPGTSTGTPGDWWTVWANSPDVMEHACRGFALYAAIRSLQRRYRAVPIALGVVVAALAIVFTLTDNIVGVFMIMPIAIIAWFVFIRPTHRKRYREAIANLPRWDLRADGP